MIDPVLMRPDFDRLWPKLERAVLKYGPTHRKEDVWADIEAGTAQFWIGKESAMVTQIVVYPTGFTELRGWLAAGVLEEIEKMETHVAGWAKERGCARAVLMARRGFRKAFRSKGYRERMAVLIREF
jgi:hypothetical protein